MAAWGGGRLTDDFLNGERYLKDADVTRRFLEALPMRDIPAQHVIVKPLDRTDSLTYVPAVIPVTCLCSELGRAASQPCAAAARTHFACYRR